MPTTFTLTVDVHTPDGKPNVGVRVEAVLVDRTSLEQAPRIVVGDGAVLWPLREVTCTDGAGSAELDLIPTSLIEGGTLYAVAVDGQLIGYHSQPGHDIHWSDVTPVTPLEPGDHQSYIIVKDTPVVTLADVMAATGFTGNAGPVPAYTGQKYAMFVRPEDQGGFQAVYLYAENHPNTQNQIGAWNQQPDALEIEGTRHLILAPDGPLSPPVGYTFWLEVV